MTLYSLVLFVHVAGVLSLFAVLTVEVLALFRLRRASTLNEVRLWINPVPGLPLAATGSLLAVLFSGLYLIIRMSAFGEAWPRVTIAAMLLVAPIAGATARRMSAIRRACAASTAISAELQSLLHDPVLKISLGIRISVVLGIVLLMGAKPGLWESVGIVGASVALGVVSPFLTLRHAPPLSAPRANPETRSE